MGGGLFDSTGTTAEGSLTETAEDAGGNGLAMGRCAGRLDLEEEGCSSGSDSLEDSLDEEGP